MTRKTLLTLSVAALLASGAVVAATQPTDGTSARQHPSLQQLDKNGDGLLQRSETTAAPRLASHFDAIDGNKDGALSRDEMKASRAQSGGRGHHRGPGGHGQDGGIAKLDKDGDGRISEVEVASNPRLSKQFAAIDRNKDASLTRGEVRQWGEQQRATRMADHEKRSAEKFAEADLNRDGKLSRVEASEAMPRLADSFAWMDENRDGFLSRSELQPPRRK